MGRGLQCKGRHSPPPHTHTQSTASMSSAQRMLTTSFPPQTMVDCVHGTWTTSPSHRYPSPSESRYPGHSLQESLELVSRGAKQVAVTALSFPSNDVNKFIVGSQECTAYQVYSCCCMCVCFCVSLDLSQGQRHGSKPGLAVQFDGHHGPVTSVSCHRATGGQYDLSHLFLSSSFDWTVKLWSTKLQNEQQLTVSICTESHKLPDSCFPCVEQDREPSLFI